ncbi:hypothetical protein TNCV_784011, partial [Trichonephila clavipes]
SRGRYLQTPSLGPQPPRSPRAYSDRPLRGSEPPRERRGKHHAYKRRAHP